MNKIKTVKKNGVEKIIIKSQKGQQLSEREAYSINSNEVKGLLHFDIEQKRSYFKLIYNITGFITFADYLAAPLNKEIFARILENILTNLQSMQNSYFNQERLLMDFSQVMVNPSTQTIHFIYIPIQGENCGISLKEFLLNIIQYATFDAEEDKNYVKEYITILNSGVNFSVFELEQYVSRLSGKKINKKYTECPKCHSKLDEGTNYCPHCGFKVSGNTGDTRGGTYNPFVQDNQDIEKEKVKTPKATTQGLSDGTTVLGADPGGTTVLGSEELDNPVYPYLIRIKNEEKIMVDKPSFRIGKEKQYSDYFVSDNSAVSRSHADIITRDKRYFIIDLNSTNKTYVDGRAIPVKKEVEIFSGTKLRLANEDFVFYE